MLQEAWNMFKSKFWFGCFWIPEKFQRHAYMRLGGIQWEEPDTTPKHTSFSFGSLWQRFSLNSAFFSLLFYYISFRCRTDNKNLRKSYKSLFLSVGVSAVFREKDPRCSDINFSWRLSRLEFLQFLLQAAIWEADSSCLFTCSSCLLRSVSHLTLNSHHATRDSFPRLLRTPRCC